jgi:hypothetical protein
MIDTGSHVLYTFQKRGEADWHQWRRCQRGVHDMLATATPGIVVCRLCRTLGVCLWCGLSLPLGARITVCSQHLGLVRWQVRHPPTVETWLLDDIEEDAHGPR